MHDDQPKAIEARAEIARRNGAVSRGPITAEGKARSAINATRHGLCARTIIMGEGENVAELAALRSALLARWQPVDAAEAHLVEELVFAAWRQVRLRAVEDAVLARAERGEEPSPALPSLATLMRYRGRIERDARQASEQLWALRRGRKEIADPLQLRWLAEQIEHARAVLAGPPAAADLPTTRDCTNELPMDTNEPTGLEQTSEPEQSDCTNELPRGMNEPSDPLPPLARAEPSFLNRHERRRLAALARHGLRAAA